MKLLFFAAFLLSIHASFAQSMEGTYSGNEPRNFEIHESGEIIFYPPSLYPWYFEVKVIIKGDVIHLYKRYIYKDSLGLKHYADSLTNTYHYAAQLTKAGDRYLAKTVLVNQPAGYIYIRGKYSKEANIYYNTDLLKTKAGAQNQYRNYAYSDGRFHVSKEQIEQDLIIRPDINGIWINNKFFKKIGSGKNTPAIIP